MNRKIILMYLLVLFPLTLGAYSFEELRALGGAEPVGLSGTLDGIVVSDWRSDNMEVNPNTDHNMVDIGENLRTAYVESFDGRFGFRLKFDRIYGNRLCKGDMVRITLDGCSLVLQKDPERYTIMGLKPEMVDVVRSSVPVPVKRKHIEELSPEDVYTYVTLEGAEFPKKTGGYININEISAQRSALNDEIWIPEKNAWLPGHGAADCWARIVSDDEGASIFMLVNSTCGWRRNDMGVPKGIGTVSGIIVHSDLPRYGASMGDYCIRPVDRSDIDMPQEFMSSYVRIASWEYDYNKYGELAFVNNGPIRFVKPGTVRNDRIRAESGDGYVWTDSGAWITLDEEYDARHTFDGWKPARMLGARSNAAIRFDAKANQWYRFGSKGDVEGYNGIYLETSTADVADRPLYFDFSFVASREHSRYAKDFPVEWKVSYSVDGDDFVELPQVYILRPMIATNIQLGKRLNMKMHGEMAMGFIEHSVRLPEELCGKEKLVIRLAPCSDVTAVLPEKWNGPSAVGEASPDMDSDVIIRFGTLSVKYLKQ